MTEPYSEWHSRWGDAVARAMFAGALAGLQTLRDVIATADITCDAMPDGWLKLPAPVSAPLPRFPFAAFRRLGQGDCDAMVRLHG